MSEMPWKRKYIPLKHLKCFHITMQPYEYLFGALKHPILDTRISVCPSSAFVSQRAKKASAVGQSPPHELTVRPHSRLYLIVDIIIVSK